MEILNTCGNCEKPIPRERLDNGILVHCCSARCQQERIDKRLRGGEQAAHSDIIQNWYQVLEFLKEKEENAKQKFFAWDEPSFVI